MNLFLYTLPFTQPEFYVWAFCIGFNIAMVLCFILKSLECDLFNKLFSSNAMNKESATTLGSLGVRCMPLVKLMLRDNGTLRKTVLLANDQRTKNEQGKMPKIDFSTATFYINEEQLERAESLRKGATKWYLLPIFCALSIGVTLFVNFMLPILINW